MKYLKYLGTGEYRGDCTADVFFELIGNPTVKELCDEIVFSKENADEWGYLGIHKPSSTMATFNYPPVFGDPYIEYFRGNYVDDNRRVISFNLPEDIANRRVVEVRAEGGWSRMDYLFKIE